MLASLLGVDFICLVAGLLVFTRISRVTDIVNYFFRNLRAILPKNIAIDAMRSGPLLPDTLEINNIKWYRAIVPLKKFPFYKEMELLFLWCTMVIAVFWLSDFVSMVSKTTFSQRSTSIFMASSVFFSWTILGVINRLGSQSDKQLSLVSGIISCSSAILFSAYVAFGHDTYFKSLSITPGISMSAAYVASQTELDHESAKKYLTWAVIVCIGIATGIWSSIIALPAFRFGRIFHETANFEVFKKTDQPLAGGLHTAKYFLLLLTPLIVFLSYFDYLVVDIVSILPKTVSWALVRSEMFVLLSFINVLSLPHLVQGHLNSAFLVLQQISFSERKNTAAVELAAASTYQFTCLATVQFSVPVIVTLMLSLLRVRYDSSDNGLVSILTSLVLGVHGNKLELDQSSPLDSITKLMQSISAAFPDSFVTTVLDNLLFWINGVWFIGVCLALMYWKFESYDSYAARKFAETYQGKSVKVAKAE